MAVELNPEYPATAAIEVVEHQVNNIQSMASGWMTQLESIIAGMARVELDPVGGVVPLPPLEPTHPAWSQARPPTLAQVDLEIPLMPSIADLDALLRDVSLGDIDLPQAPVHPSINIPSAPNMAAITAPVRPDIDTNVEMPAAPAIAWPEMEALLEIRIPEFQFPDIPDFTADAPDGSGLQVPDIFLNWQEPSYQPLVLNELTAQIRAWLAGGTGLPPAVENALFARAHERISTEGRRQEQAAITTWAARGFSMPPGMLQAQIEQVREQNRTQVAELNRDTFTQAAQWEIENLRQAVSQGIALEQMNANIAQQAAGRLFEAAKITAQMQLDVFGARVNLFNAQQQAYRTLADVFKTRVDAILSRVQAWRVQVEGLKLQSDMNTQKVEVFKARMQAVAQAVAVYEAQMKAAQVHADLIRARFDAYRADVQAYAESVGAEKVKFDAYDSQVKGELGRVQMYESSSRAYAATIDGLQAKSNLKRAAVDTRIALAQAKVQEFIAKLDGFKAQLQANLSKEQLTVTAFQGEVDAWRAEAGVKTAQAEVDARYADMNTRTNLAYMETQMTQFNMLRQQAVNKAQIALDALKSMGQLTAQMAAGALSAINVTAQISGSGTGNYTRSENYSYQM